MAMRYSDAVSRLIIGFDFSVHLSTSGEGVNQLSNAIAKASTMSPFVFVGMDSHGYSPLWAPEGTKLDRIGESVEEALCEGGLLVLNNQDSPPTFVVTWGIVHG